MPNMSPEKTRMREQNPQTRNKNFTEVALGYTEEEAINEAERCLNCKNKPCVTCCPVGVPIPDFISLIKSGEFQKAGEKIKEMNLLPAVCGRVCPQEKQCEKMCVRGISHEPVAIGRLERFAADYLIDNKSIQNTHIAPNGKRVAVIGSGPAGLSCAGSLAARGYDVTIFEALHRPGGVLVYGIPEFRLPNSIVEKEIENLKDMGVKIVTNFIVGKSGNIDEFFDNGYKAVFVASGAGLPMFMGIPGEDLNGVYSANEFLTRVNLMKAYEENSDTPILKVNRVAVIGGGNVAMDAARCAKRIGAEEVKIIYRRTKKELPARREEIHHAVQEGIVFEYLTSPVRINDDGNGYVSGIRCVNMELSYDMDSDARGRSVTKPIKNSEHNIDADCVIIAIGTTPNPLISKTTPKLQTSSRGCLVLQQEDKCLTTQNGVYAGGDVVTGAATVILAMGAGKQAASAIDEYVKNMEE